MDKEKLEKELVEIDGRIKKKEEEIENNPEYRLLKSKLSNLWETYGEKSDKLNRLRRGITEKYIKRFRSWGYRNLEIKNIKSSVKEGIKRGLGVKYINLIGGDNIIKIVKELIKEDLEKSKEKNILSEIEEINKERKKAEINKEKLRGELNTLAKERKKIENKLNRRELNKEKKRKGVKKIIEEKLPDLIEKIRGEVVKELMLEALEEGNK